MPLGGTGVISCYSFAPGKYNRLAIRIASTEILKSLPFSSKKVLVSVSSWEPQKRSCLTGLSSLTSPSQAGSNRGMMMATRIFLPGIVTFSSIILLASLGCAHRRQPYAYAPPYSPPVYPQPGLPQQAVPAQPVAYPGTVQTPLPPNAVVAPTSPVSPQGYPAGVVPTAASLPCPPTCDPCTAGGVVMPATYEGPVQSQPCPPAP